MDTEQLLRETRIPFTQLAQEQNVSIPTVWRWAQRGIRGHVLESFSVGIRKFTTRKAFVRFIWATNAQPAPCRTNRRRAADRRKAHHKLRKAGLLFETELGNEKTRPLAGQTPDYSRGTTKL